MTVIFSLGKKCCSSVTHSTPMKPAPQTRTVAPFLFRSWRFPRKISARCSSSDAKVVDGGLLDVYQTCDAKDERMQMDRERSCVLSLLWGRGEDSNINSTTWCGMKMGGAERHAETTTWSFACSSRMWRRRPSMNRSSMCFHVDVSIPTSWTVGNLGTSRPRLNSDFMDGGEPGNEFVSIPTSWTVGNLGKNEKPRLLDGYTDIGIRLCVCRESKHRGRDAARSNVRLPVYRKQSKTARGEKLAPTLVKVRFAKLHQVFGRRKRRGVQLQESGGIFGVGDAEFASLTKWLEPRALAGAETHFVAGATTAVDRVWVMWVGGDVPASKKKNNSRGTIAAQTATVQHLRSSMESAVRTIQSDLEHLLASNFKDVNSTNREEPADGTLRAPPSTRTATPLYRQAVETSYADKLTKRDETEKSEPDHSGHGWANYRFAKLHQIFGRRKRRGERVQLQENGGIFGVGDGVRLADGWNRGRSLGRKLVAGATTAVGRVWVMWGGRHGTLRAPPSTRTATPRTQRTPCGVGTWRSGRCSGSICRPPRTRRGVR